MGFNYSLEMKMKFFIYIFKKGENDIYSVSIYAPNGNGVGSNGIINIGVGRNQVKINGVLDLSGVTEIIMPKNKGE